MIYSDYHIHSEYSYDSTLSLHEIIARAKEMGIQKIGITDHVNYYEPVYLDTLRDSAKAVKMLQNEHPELVLGVELTPGCKPELEYLRAHGGSRDGYEFSTSDKPFDMDLAVTLDEMREHGIQYCVGATHWRVDVADRRTPGDVNTFIKDWHRQQMWLACDERVTIVGHPWYSGAALWYEDFSVVPHSMHLELGAAIKENGKIVECNPGIMCSPRASEKYSHQYAEFLRELFEMGIRVCYGSDCHNEYTDQREISEKYLRAAGFTDGDFYSLTEKDYFN